MRLYTAGFLGDIAGSDGCATHAIEQRAIPQTETILGVSKKVPLGAVDPRSSQDVALEGGPVYRGRIL
jgi:hypothetical protein